MKSVQTCLMVLERIWISWSIHAFSSFIQIHLFVQVDYSPLGPIDYFFWFSFSQMLTWKHTNFSLISPPPPPFTHPLLVLICQTHHSQNTRLSQQDQTFAGTFRNEIIIFLSSSENQSGFSIFSVIIRTQLVTCSLLTMLVCIDCWHACTQRERESWTRKRTIEFSSDFDQQMHLYKQVHCVCSCWSFFQLSHTHTHMCVWPVVFKFVTHALVSHWTRLRIPGFACKFLNAHVPSSLFVTHTHTQAYCSFSTCVPCVCSSWPCRIPRKVIWLPIPRLRSRHHRCRRRHSLFPLFAP